MKKYNFDLPQVVRGSLDTEAIEEIFEEKESAYGHGNHLPMRKQISGTKKKVDQGWRQYDHGSEIWHKINCKLSSYVGWNIDKAFSDFIKWGKKNCIPGGFDLRYGFNREFRPYDRRWYTSSYVVDKNNIIRTAPPSAYRIKKIHEKYYNNMGHQLLGYKLKNDILNCPECVEMLHNRLGRSIQYLISGGLASANEIKNIDGNAVYAVTHLFNELYGRCRVWNPKTCLYEYVPGKYYRRKYGYAGKTIDSLFEEVYTPDIWIKKTDKELALMHRNNAHAHKSKKMSKTERRQHAEQVYNDAIRISKGVAARSAAENLITIERHGFTKDSFKAFGGQPNL